MTLGASGARYNMLYIIIRTTLYMVLAFLKNPKSPEHAAVGHLKQRMREWCALFLVVLDKER